MERNKAKFSNRFDYRTSNKKIKLEKLYQNFDNNLAPIKESIYPDDMQDVKEALSIISTKTKASLRYSDSRLKPVILTEKVDVLETEKPTSSSPTYKSFKIRKIIRLKK